MRLCKPCNTEKPYTAEYWGRDRNRKHGLKTRCRECERAERRKGGPYYAEETRTRYTFRTAGVHYKTALPPEKWTTIQHFLGELNYYAGLAEKAGVKPNVSEFLAEWGGHNRGRRVIE